ncbi:S9 family peptidase [Microbispora sp. NEAU-D428]|uniref:S9 family peptidase n=1 Tax=Microbispora sitophila TaxID=2771537 RepID=UPI0018669E39|nr:alpha/beta fold hydrolase [Microbispora sitophila]MBE3012133.1 S9 family peptidase [Microbispora sitophila]
MSVIVTPAGRAAGESRLPDAQRINFRFSGRGRYAACLTRRDHDHLVPEIWDLPRARVRTFRTRGGETWLSVPTPTEEGGLLLCRLGAAAHRLILVGAPAYEGGRAEEHEVGALHGDAVRIVASPTAGTAALAFTSGPDGRTSVWRLSDRGERPERITVLPCSVRGGVWLDEAGRRLALTRVGPEAATVVLDVTGGTLTPLTGPAHDERLLLAAPGAGVLVTAALRDGAYRLGVRALGDDGPTRRPERLNAVEGQVTPLALHPAGRRLALAVNRRTGSRLVLHDLAEDAGVDVELPAGTLLPLAHWSGAGLHVVHSAPDRPPGVVRVADGCAPRFLSEGERRETGWEPARVRTCSGAAGPVEAIVYGAPETSREVVVALHGGPEAAWQFAFDPLFQRLAAGGVAVVAPNQRGSTGYGAAHRDAIRGAWGGPDLDDVLHLARDLTARRGPARARPALYGVSYGAHLGLLAAAAQPDLWSRAAAVAPFLSGRELYEDGPPSVRALLDRLGGRSEIDDELGPRDLLRLAGRMRLPLLIVHGEDDPIIPVGHSRRLCARLREAGGREAAEVTYLEIPGGGHDPQYDVRGGAVLDAVTDFLTMGPCHRP